MANLGEILQAEREKQGMTPSEVAAVTHIKVQHIEAIERNDFSRIAAAAYARGFIKLYAEFLELDPAPLIQEYVELHAEDRPATMVPDTTPPDEERSGMGSESWVRGLSREVLKRIPWQKVAIGTAGVLLVLFLFSALSRLVRTLGSRGEGHTGRTEQTQDLGIIRDPPEPYLRTTPGANK